MIKPTYLDRKVSSGVTQRGGEGGGMYAYSLPYVHSNPFDINFDIVISVCYCCPPVIRTLLLTFIIRPIIGVPLYRCPPHSASLLPVWPVLAPCHPALPIIAHYCPSLPIVAHYCCRQYCACCGRRRSCNLRIRNQRVRRVSEEEGG